MTWDLDVLYPCSNTDYITITGSAPEKQYYPVFTESQEAPFTIDHEAFTVTVQGSNDATICGQLTYSAQVDGSPISNFSLPPIAYDSNARQFSVWSEDYDFDGLFTLTVDAYLTQYIVH